MFELECEILVKVPVPMIDSPLVLRANKGNIVRKKYELSMLSDVAKIEPKHAPGRTMILSQETENTTK